MVMIVFSDKKGRRAALNWRQNLPVHLSQEEIIHQGRYLVKQFRDCEKVIISAAGDEALSLALGMELGDYSFDKYDLRPISDCSRLEMAEILVDNPGEMRLAYEPYAALANAVRFAKDLFNEPESLYQTEQYFFEIKRLEYLNLIFKDCGNNLVSLEWLGRGEGSVLQIAAENRAASAVGAALLKAAALQKCSIGLKVWLSLENNSQELNDIGGGEVISIRKNIKTEEETEAEFWRLMQIINEGRNYEKR